ncbi:MAG: hypothetical protein ACRDCA_25180, partial [Serratia sp. (in: enterobacteria)]|uniref:hypothetical protein n=1 Tax=Serratia sp. (in: enterobacteria) TaxID=616 RepID=UPI003F2C0A81
MTKIFCRNRQYIWWLFFLIWGGGDKNSLRKIIARTSFFMVSSSNLKYKLMRHVTFNPLLIV